MHGFILGGKTIKVEFESESTVKQKAEPPAGKPTPCMVLRNMFDPEQETGDEWAGELEEDVKDECEEKYGQVVHIKVDPQSKGDIYVKFSDTVQASKAIEGLDGRKFDGRVVAAEPMVEMVYSLKFKL